MKTWLITLALILFSTKIFAQYKGVVSIYYGVTSTTTPTIGTDAYAYRVTGAPIYGFTIGGPLFYNIKWFSVETGAFFTDNKSQLTQLPNGPGVVSPAGDIRMVIIPFYLRFAFLKYLFVYGGFSFDNQTNASSDGIEQSQSGYGVEAGFGVKYKSKHIIYSLTPFVFDHGVFHIFNKDSNFELNEKGVKFGIGYAF